MYVQSRAGIAQWLECWTRDWKVTDLSPCRSSGRIFFSRVNFLCWLLFRYLFHPRVTAVARKRSQSFCQKCRWQVTAKHACTLHMWLCMKWWSDTVYVYMVYTNTEHAEMAAVSRGISHVGTVSTPLQWIFFFKLKKEAILPSWRITCKRSESAQEWRTALYKKWSTAFFKRLKKTYTKCKRDTENHTQQCQTSKGDI